MITDIFSSFHGRIGLNKWRTELVHHAARLTEPAQYDSLSSDSPWPSYIGHHCSTASTACSCFRSVCTLETSPILFVGIRCDCSAEFTDQFFLKSRRDRRRIMYWAWRRHHSVPCSRARTSFIAHRTSSKNWMNSSDKRLRPYTRLHVL